MSSFSAVSKTDRGLNKLTPNAAKDKEMQELYKQKMKVQDEINRVNNNQEMDSKLKMERVKTLTSSMQQIDSRISELKMENMKKNSPEKASSDSKAAPSKSAQDPELAIIIEKSATYSQLSQSVELRAKLDGEIKTLEGGVRFDRTLLESSPSNDNGKSMMLQNAEDTVFKMKREMVQDIQVQRNVVDQRIKELVSEINDTEDSSETRPIIIEDVPENNESQNNASNTKVQQEDVSASTGTKEQQEDVSASSDTREQQGSAAASSGSSRPEAAFIDIRV